jgi:type II secretory pathway pseudopilin PulG
VKLRSRSAGFSLVELIIAVTVMVLLLITMMVAITSASRINDNSRERAIAYELAKSKIEEIRNFTRCGSFDKIFWYYGYTANPKIPNPNGWIYVGNATLPDPLQLNAMKIAGVPQPIITVTFPINTLTGALTENPTDANMIAHFAMPKDLNRNGLTTDFGAVLSDPLGATAPVTGYKILPVLVTVQWESTGKKNGKVELASLIAEK